jgi:hypothetical protein
MKPILFIVASVALFILMESCVKEEARQPDPLVQTCDTISASYSNDIRPILNTSCVGSSCHSDVGAPISGGISLQDYDDAKQYADNGQLVCAVKGDGCEIMPPVGVIPLTQEQILQIECWAFNGAPNN